MFGVLTTGNMRYDVSRATFFPPDFGRADWLIIAKRVLHTQRYAAFLPHSMKSHRVARLRVQPAERFSSSGRRRNPIGYSKAPPLSVRFLGSV